MVEIRMALSNIKITQATHMHNQTGKKLLPFASQQCKTTLQCTNTGCHEKTEIHSYSTTSFQTRFDTVGLLIVPKMERNVERFTFFRGYRSSGSRAQMDTQPIKIFLHGWNEEMHRTIGQIMSC
ncbi:hypothetical protein TNCV_4290601 [Trichonephila clavipes]|nr:hypothetical protein TNCV_4290601 [Trichonephila clavipes]